MTNNTEPKGILYGVSVGPGDPELLTVKALKAMEGCPVLAYPASGSQTNVALEIARQAMGGLADKVLLQLDFPMLHNRQALDASHDGAAALVMEQLELGRNVAMLTLGDASLYATYSYLQSRVLAAGYQAVTIPGVPSFCAVAAKLNRSLTQPHLPLHIIPAAYPCLESCLDYPGTKVLMKAGKDLPRVCQLLAERGCKAQIIENCGLPGERIFRDLSQVEQATGYFTTIVVEGEEG